MNRNKISILIGIAAALVVLLGAVWYVLYGASSPVAVSAPLIDRSGVWFDDPGTKYLVVPKIGIDTKIEEVGRTESGNMANPSSFHTVAWYRHGTAPGGIGSAVIAGHVDNALSLAGVFKELHTLASGDEVHVVTASTTLRYKVLRLEEYPYDNAPLAEIFGRTDGRYLNLVTCAGTWLPGIRTYDKRLIVYTELLE
ncbi:MAG TPA: class F sortase [Candidatus Paceibacterota bacterium]|nr:class F sortase [Candidatus Paceibacterota bacterium]